MLLHKNFHFIFVMVGWNVRLKDKPVLTPNQKYELRMDEELLERGYWGMSEIR